MNTTSSPISAADFFGIGNDSPAPVTRPQGPGVPFAGDLDSLIQSEASKYGMDPALVGALVHQESGGDSGAVSGKGATGTMQLMPDTARDIARQMGDNFDERMLKDPAMNIRWGTKYVADQLQAFGGDPRFALVAYHSGPDGAQKVYDEYQKTGVFKVPKIRRYWDGVSFTADYVDNIMNRSKAGFQQNVSVPVSANERPTSAAEFFGLSKESSPTPNKTPGPVSAAEFLGIPKEPATAPAAQSGSISAKDFFGLSDAPAAPAAQPENPTAPVTTPPPPIAAEPTTGTPPTTDTTGSADPVGTFMQRVATLGGIGEKEGVRAFINVLHTVYKGAGKLIYSPEDYAKFDKGYQDLKDTLTGLSDHEKQTLEESGLAGQVTTGAVSLMIQAPLFGWASKVGAEGVGVTKAILSKLPAGAIKPIIGILSKVNPEIAQTVERAAGEFLGGTLYGTTQAAGEGKNFPEAFAEGTKTGVMMSTGAVVGKAAMSAAEWLAKGSKVAAGVAQVAGSAAGFGAGTAATGGKSDEIIANTILGAVMGAGHLGTETASGGPGVVESSRPTESLKANEPLQIPNQTPAQHDAALKIMNRRDDIESMIQGSRDPGRLRKRLVDGLLGEYGVTTKIDMEDASRQFDESGISYAITAGDIGNMKAVNDVRGSHPAADADLKAVFGDVWAREVQKAGGIPFRTGGDELGELWPGRTAAEAKPIRDQIETMIREKRDALGWTETPHARNGLPTGALHTDYAIVDGAPGKFSESFNKADAETLRQKIINEKTVADANGFTFDKKAGRYVISGQNQPAQSTDPQQPVGTIDGTIPPAGPSADLTATSGGSAATAERATYRPSTEDQNALAGLADERQRIIDAHRDETSRLADASNFRQDVLKEFKDAELDQKSNEWQYIIGKRTRDARGNLITIPDNVRKVLTAMAERSNLHRENGGTVQDDPLGWMIQDKGQTLTADDLVNVIREGQNKKDLTESLKGADERLTGNLSKIDAEIKAYQNGTARTVLKKTPLPAAVGQDLNAPISEAGKTVNDYIDEVAIPMGQSIKLTTKKTLNDNVALPPSVNPEVETRWKNAHGITQPSFMSKVRQATADVKKSFTRHFPHLDPKTDGAVIDILRQHEATPDYSKVAAVTLLRGVTSGFGPKKLQVFEKAVILPDMVKDIEAGRYDAKNLPFGYKSRDEVQKDLDTYKAVADANPDIKAAIERRDGVMNALRKEAVDAGLLPAKVLEDPRYFHHQILEHIGIDELATGTASKDVRTHQKSWQKGREGSAKDFNTSYLESEYEVVSQLVSQIETAKTLSRLQERADISKTLVKGEKIPAGYVKWQPEKGNLFYTTFTLPEKLADAVVNSGMYEVTSSDVREAMAVGQKKTEWIIPEGLARTLDNFQSKRDEGPLAIASRRVMTAWKQWTLLNPLRAVKYNVNNLSGDFDITFAYDPRISKHAWLASKDLANYNIKNRNPSPEMLDAIKKAVIGSGITVEEIPNISKSEFFAAMSGKSPNLINHYWGNVRKFTEWRENILRLSAYRFFKEELAKGKNLYGASKKSEIDAITNPEDKAAKLARELVGDYGNVSQAGVWLRDHVIPFYSWIEINAPRYVRLLKNIPHEGESDGKAGRIAGAVALKTGANFAGFAVKATALYALARIWNQTFFKDEEKKLGEAGRDAHIILGKNTDTGEIISLRFQGALADALSWIDAQHLPDDVADLASGKMTAGEKALNVAKAPLNKIWSSLGPQFKLPIELAAGVTTYPDVTNPRPIRDKAEYAAKAVSLDLPYRSMMGKPSRGIGDEAARSIVYISDPGETAYFDAKKIVAEHVKKTGDGSGGGIFTPDDRSNALYYYKKALTYEDTRAADKWLAEYKRLGGTDRTAEASIRRADPLEGIPPQRRTVFMNSLSASEQQKIKDAVEWYNSVYGPHMRRRGSTPPPPPARNTSTPGPMSFLNLPSRINIPRFNR